MTNEPARDAEWAWDGLHGPYRTLVVDPPWHYDERVLEYGRGESRSGAMPYSTMSVEEIAALPVFDLVDRKSLNHLYLWTTNRYLRDAYDIAYGWGFFPTQCLVWCKPPRGLSPGGLYANATEFVVFAQRGPNTEHRLVPRAGSLIRSAREAARHGSIRSASARSWWEANRDRVPVGGRLLNAQRGGLESITGNAPGAA